MTELQDPKRPPRRLTALTDRFVERGGDEDWLADPDAPSEADDHHDRPPRAARSGRAKRGPRRLVPIGLGAIALVVAVIFVASQLRGTTKALADPRKAAAAAELAGSFAFRTRSELVAGGMPTVVSTTTGEVVGLQGSGAFRVRVIAPSGIGFERIVFPDAVYVRVLGARGSQAWVGSHLRPRVQISTEAGSAGGLGDPLSLLRGLAQSRHARSAGTRVIDGRETHHYSLTLPLGELLPAGTAASATLRAIHVHIDLWQASDQQLVRAVRTFYVGGPQHLRLTIRTDFLAYGRAPAIKPPARTPLAGDQPLNPTADDPLGESVLGSLAGGRGHSATPNATPAPVPGVGGAAAAGPGPSH